MRGKALFSNTDLGGLRITPAYAGKRYPYTEIRFESWDHPRLCGEKSSPTTGTNTAMGSPPPMRGKVLNEVICAISLRITPAYAGKSIPVTVQYRHG